MFDMEFSECLNDDSIGPAVQGCRDGFDFTLSFEKIFLSILPAAIFISATLPRVVYLIRRPAVVRAPVYQSVKLTVAALYAVLQLSVVVLASIRPARLSGLFTASAVLNLIVSLCICALSFFEHARSPRPSMLLNAFLLLSILFDITQARSLWMSTAEYDERAFSAVFTATVAVKAIMLGLESVQKSKWVQWDPKEHSPEETSGLYGLGVFFWLNSLFVKGYNKLLKIPDLFPLDQNMSAEILQRNFAKRIEEGKFRGQKNGLAKELLKALAVPYLLPVAPRIALTGFTFCQPFLIQTLLNYLQQPESPNSANIGKGLIGATVLIYIGVSLSTAFYWYLDERALFMTRGCLAAAVYRKTTEAQLSAADDSAAVTLMSTDVERIRMGFLFIHEYWANTIEVGLASWLLQRQLGAAFAAPIVVVLVCIAMSAGLSRYATPRQKAWMEKIQKRVGHTASVIGNMKHLKISGLTAPVEEAIQQLRVDDLRTGARFRMIIILSAVVSFVPLAVGPVVTFGVTSATLDVTTVFTSISYLVLLANPLGLLFQTVPSMLAALACFRRIQSFLEKDPRKDYREGGGLPILSEKTLSSDPDEKPFAVKLSNASFGWVENTFNLHDITATIPSGSLTIVVGPIASGKSTLCKAFLGETPVQQGHVILGSHFEKIGYCDQIPYLSNATIRENIVGFSAFNEKRYREVIDAAALSKDLLMFPQGDHTRIGTDGISLSGGQKQRVSIARALYLESDLLIFDDILSGLDADTEDQVFESVFGIQGMLKKRSASVVLCTHSIRHLPVADHIIALGTDGRLVEEGSFADLVANKKYVHSLGVKASEGRRSGSNTPPPDVDDPMFIVRSKTVDSTAEDPSTDLARKLGDTTVYKHYFSSLGTTWLVAFVLSGAICGFFFNFPTIWLKYWSEDVTSPHPVHSSAFYIGLYALFQMSGLLALFANILICFRYMVQMSGAALHQAALKTVIGAPLRFFTTTDSGVVTNLFSQDMTLIDGELPISLLNLSLDTWIAAGQAALIATSSPWLAISYPFIVAVLYCIQRFYLRTSRQLRLLDLEAKSPLYTHFLDTIKGLATFRALGWVPDALNLNNDLLDTSQRPAYLLAMIQRWLIFVLSLVVATLAVVVVTLSVHLRSNTAFTGAGLVSLMSFGEILANIIRMYTQLETSIGAVSRLKTFSEKTTPEALPGEDVVPAESWPTQGRIEIRNISATYGDPQSTLSSESSRPGSPNSLALHNLNLTIETGEKVAICGRSGSGKSSTILLLLRLLDPLPSIEGSTELSIDALPLSTIDRAALRRRIIAVPQDAVFLPEGTSVRANLDPFRSPPDDAAADAECQAVLEAVDLWGAFADRGGLDAGLVPDALSQGQKQLFGLARAILRRRIRTRSGAAGGVLLLDEVSSSVDVDTDRAMQKIIQKEFEGYTIVMVSHRLEMVMEFDKVVVMDAGAVVEEGPPRVLVEKEGGRFRDLWLVGNRE